MASTEMAAAKAAMEAARIDVMECEKEIVAIKNAIKSVSASPSGEEETNALCLSALKIMDTSSSDESKEKKMPTLKLQLSSPIEELTLTKLRDPLDEKAAGSVATFNDVDVNVATLTITAEELNGTSASYDLAPLCSYDWEKDDVMSLDKRIRKKISEIDVAIVSNGDDAPQKTAAPVSEAKPDDVDDVKTAEKVETSEAQSDDVENSKAKEEVETKTAETDEDKSAGDVVSIEESKSEEDAVVVEKNEAVKVEDTKKEEGTNAETKKEDVTSEDAKKEEEKAETKEKEESSTTVEEEPKKEDSSKETSGEAKVEEKKTETKKADSDDVEEIEEKETPTPSSKNRSVPSVEVPLCAIKLRVEFEPSTKDLKDALYDKLNEASKKKALAINRLRQSAASVSRITQSKPSPASSAPDKAAVQSGFLNKKSDTKKKEPSFLVRWYNKTIGPTSLVRTVGPIFKNYIIFFSAVIYMHYRGYDLALPPPV
mmetsp:Transcript_6188/g.7962  ORF Transcript_6188/g.7962 Transcript_6188/m.7962 type:complete len:485 (-) Transcript_6188:200-1654(-)